MLPIAQYGIRYSLNGHIARLMPMLIINGLEIIHIDNHQKSCLDEP